MRKRLLAFLLCVSMLLPLLEASLPAAYAEETVPVETTAPTEAPTELSTEAPTEAPTDAPAAVVSEDYGADVGKYATFNIAELGFFDFMADPSTEGESITFTAEEISADLTVVITDWYVDSLDGVWYKIEAAPDHSLPEDMAQNPWVLDCYVGDDLFSLIKFDAPEEPTEPEETEPEETEPEETEPETCPVCGQVGCAALHFYCDICEKHDCGLDHLYCSLCGIYDCTENHVWCGTCGVFDCGETHEDIYTPAQTPIIPETPTLTEGAAVSVVEGSGEAVTADGLVLSEGRKLSLSAWTELEGDVSYQWQICYDMGKDLWVNIHGQTGKGILISPAMFLPLLENQGEAAIRCVASSGEETRIGETIPVTVTAQGGAYALSGSSDSGAAAQAEGDAENTVTLIVSYIFVNGEIAANPWTATLPKGEPYTTTAPITVPTIAGYAPTYGGAQLTDNELKLDLTGEQLNQDLQITITYQPIPVNVTIRHHLQNVADDNYTLNETVIEKIETGKTVGSVEKTIPGFYALLYEHPVVAADGSTVVDVYYDRYYYLMKFEVGEGGYGVEPIYDRFGANITVGKPTRAGYVFDGWLDENGNYVVVADTMPVGGATYTAKWTKADTHYTVSYWIVNDDGTRTLIGSYLAAGISGDYADGWDNLGPMDDIKDRGVICGEESEHIHTAECYSCDQEEHDHFTTCFTNLSENDPGDNGKAVIAAIKDGTNPQSGYIYVIKTANGNLWPKLYLNGKYYSVNGVGSGNTPASDDGVNSIIVGGPLGEATVEFTNETLSVTKYKAKTNCGSAHHEAGCIICEEHAHTAACYYDTKHVVYVEKVTIEKADGTKVTYETDKGVEIKGDGSSVVNVYYAYKTYTIRFIYARKNAYGNYQIATLTKDGALNNCTWTGVSNCPTVIKDPSGNTQTTSVQIGNATYYYISLKAKFGAEITDLWPSANINAIGNYKWGSWAAAPDTEYRKKDPEHANIVGPYPVMSAEMIGENPELLSDGTYLAQNMVAWWGASNKIGPHAYHIYYEVLPSQMNDPGNVVYGGKQYKLVTTYTFTAAHNDTTRVDPIFFNGFKCINDTSAEDYEGEDLQANSNHSSFSSNGCEICKSNNCSWHNNFYYNRNLHKIYFWNYTGFLQEGEGSEMPFGASLHLHGEQIDAEFMALPENYPTGLEPGAYQFAGWYTTDDFLEGTEMNWNTTMPDADMTVYAKWEPVTHTVRFFLDKTQYEAGITIPQEYPDSVYAEKFYAHTVSHGSELVADDGDFVPGSSEENPHRYAGWTFEGWFYMDNGVEKAFVTGENGLMVNQDLDLYAKWSNNVLCPYEIYFQLAEVDQNGEYSLVLDENGNPINVADPITGSTLAGNSRTFDAKGDSALYAAYQNGFFPNVASHTIRLEPLGEDADGNPIPAVFVFMYTRAKEVPYTVKYLELGTDKELRPTQQFQNNTKAVVTENFIPVSGYMPDAYQKTLVVVPGADNVITFYYTADTEHALYQINHYTENLDGGWTEYRSETVTGDIDNIYSATPITITGFNFSVDDTQANNARDVTFDTGTNTLSGTLTAEGLQLNLYYTRQEFEYTVRYLEFGTDEELHEPKEGTAKYGELVTENAVKIEKDLDGDGRTEDFQLYAATQDPQTITIYGDGQEIVFYYVRCTQTMTVTKQVVDGNTSDDSEPDNTLSFNFQLTSTADDFGDQNYKYEIKSGESVTADGYLTPKEGTLSFSLKDGETITIEGLPTAEYTLTEQNVPTGYYDAYSTEHQGANGRYKLTVDDPVAITVTNTYDPTVLELTKTVGVVEAGNIPEVEKFEFTVTVPDGVTGTFAYALTTRDEDGDVVKTEEKSVSVAGGTMVIELQRNQTARFVNLPLGAYTVGEKDYSAEGYKSHYVVNGAAPIVLDPSVEVELVRGGTQTVECVNNFPVGDLVIEKIISKEFCKTRFPDGDLEFTFTLLRTTTGKPLKENNTYGVYAGTELISTATVDADGNLQVTITFTLTDEEQTLLDGTQGAAVTRTITVRNLPAGTYSVTEDADPAYGQTASGYSRTGDAKTDATVNGLAVSGLTIPANETRAIFANELKRTTGDLSLKKLLVKEEGFKGELPTDTVFEFTFELTELPPAGSAEITYVLTDAQNNQTTKTAQMTDGSFTIEIMMDQTVAFTGLPIGTYKITETSIPHYANSFTGGITSAEIVDGVLTALVEVETGSPKEVQCTNVYPVNLADLTIIRNNAEADQVFVYQVTDGKDLTITVTVTGNGSTTIHDLPLGEYTVTQLNGWSWRYEDGSKTVELGSNGEEVEFGGKATKDQWLNGNSEPVKNIHGGGSR